MSNPKDPRVSRTLGEPPVPIGFDLPADDRGLPVDRFRRVGADDDVIGYLQEVWDSLDDDGRTEWLAELDVSTDAELADELDFDVEQRPDGAEPGIQQPGSIDAVTGEELPPPVEGKVVHEGGGGEAVQNGSWFYLRPPLPDGTGKVHGKANIPEGYEIAE